MQKHFDPHLYFGGVRCCDLSVTNLAMQHRVNELFLGLGDCGSSEESDIFNKQEDSVLKPCKEELKEAVHQNGVTPLKNFLLLTPTTS